MKNTRWGGPGGCVFARCLRRFSGPRTRETGGIGGPKGTLRRTALGEPTVARPVVNGKTGKFDATKYKKKVTIFAENKQKP